MPRCFVMQPFDGGVFDKRYHDVFKPAIEAAGLEAYRIDEDPSVSFPIDEINRGIRGSEICLAEVTTDNPNVWLELGYAIALGKEVVLACSMERKSNFPFDVQHRSIIRYSVDSPRDFEELAGLLALRLKTIYEKKLRRGDSLSAARDPSSESRMDAGRYSASITSMVKRGHVDRTGSVSRFNWREVHDIVVQNLPMVLFVFFFLGFVGGTVAYVSMMRRAHLELAPSGYVRDLMGEKATLKNELEKIRRELSANRVEFEVPSKGRRQVMSGLESRMYRFYNSSVAQYDVYLTNKDGVGYEAETINPGETRDVKKRADHSGVVIVPKKSGLARGWYLRVN